jgi:hypothetical protein
MRLIYFTAGGHFSTEFNPGFSVAEPEPVERPLFGGAGAGAQAFRLGSGSGYVNSYKMLLKDLNFSSKI